jgi:deoxycytidine triphosphate deaminase
MKDNEPNSITLHEPAGREGFLVDHEIAAAIGKRLLLKKTEDHKPQYASYELHIGGVIKRLVTCEEENSKEELYREIKPHPESGKFIIRPTQTFQLYAGEDLDVPDNVFAIAIPIGNIYTNGLSPETTFADPGYSGDFYITVSNFSPRNVELKVGDPLARIFFFKLGACSEHPHTDKIRPPNLTGLKVEHPSADELEKTSEESLIDYVMDKVNPPHFQHAFLTRKMALDHHNALKKDITNLRANYGRMMFMILFCELVALGLSIKAVLDWALTAAPPWFLSLGVEIAGGLILSITPVLLIKPLREQFFEALAEIKGKNRNEDKHEK